MPALASSAATMPPAPPTPTITTSVRSVAIALAFPRRLQADDRAALVGSPALHFGLCKLRLRARKAHEPPAREIFVPAIDGIGEHAFHRVDTERAKEFARGRPGEALCFAGFERGNDFVLLCRGESRESGVVGFPGIRIELCQPVTIEFLLVRISAGKCKVDIVENARVMRAGFRRRSG